MSDFACWRAGCEEPRTDVSTYCDAHRCVVLNVGVKWRGDRCMNTTNRSDRRCETHAMREKDLLVPLLSVTTTA